MRLILLYNRQSEKEISRINLLINTFKREYGHILRLRMVNVISTLESPATVEYSTCISLSECVRADSTLTAVYIFYNSFIILLKVDIFCFYSVMDERICNFIC